MFNQSISKFSSTKLSIAVGAALLVLFVSPTTHAESLSISGWTQPTFEVKESLIAGWRGYGLANANKTHVNIVGKKLEITNDENEPPRKAQGGKPTTELAGYLYGFYNTQPATLSTDETTIALASHKQTIHDWYGVRAKGSFDVESSSLDVAISVLGPESSFKFLHGVSAGAVPLTINSSAININLNVGQGMNFGDGSGVTPSIAGVFNKGGTTNIKGDTLQIVTNVGPSKVYGTFDGLHNEGTMNVEVGDIRLTTNIESGASFVSPKDPINTPQVAAVYSTDYSKSTQKPELSISGEKLSIELLDDGEGTDNRVIQGLLVDAGNSDISSKSLEIQGHSNGGYVYGIYSQNKNTELTVTSDTKIDVKSSQAGNAYGLVATAGGTLTVDGNLEVHADKAIAVRSVPELDANKKPTGNFVPSEVVINSSGDKTVKLYGDIDYNVSNDATQHVNGSKVTVNLTGENSVWEGHTTITLNNGVVDKEGLKTAVKDGLAIEVNLKDGAKWVPDSSSTLDKGSQQTNVIPLAALSLDNGVIELTDRSGDVVNVTELRGKGGEVHAQVAIDENSNITSNKLSIKKTEGTPSLAVHAKGITADDVGDRQVAMESFYANALSLGDGASANTELHIPEGDVAGKLRGTVDSENNVTVQENPHTISSSVLSIASSNYLSFRSQINDVASRLGDLRSMPKTAGAWVRYYGGQTKYSDRGMKEDYNTIQIGGDGFIADKYYLGGTFSYTDGNGTLVNGSSDDKNYNFGIYGGWLGEKGQFVDVIVKRHRIKSDFDLFNALGKSSGSYRTWGTSASIEAGWRLQCPANGFYAEPQAEFMLGHVESVNYKTNRGVRIHQDGINSAIGRVGVAFGYTFSENKGNAYAKASVLHDWKGDVKASYSKDGVSRRMHDDLGGTWGEFAVGATYNPIKNLSAYGQFKTTTGSPIRTPWQASIGVRYSF